MAPELKAGIEKHLRTAFVLDEDSLRRFHALLEKAAREIPGDPSVVFRVAREDGRYYGTEDIDEVLSDPNVTGKRVVSVSIELQEARHADRRRPWEELVEVEFETARGSYNKLDNVSMSISTEHKNWALLLADVLEPQIQRTLRAKGTPRSLLWLFALPLGMVGVKLGWWSSGFGSLFLGLLAILVPLCIGWMVYTLTEGSPRWFRVAFGPESTFLWGEELRTYPEREQTRRNMLWAVIVGFLVSFAASCAFALIYR